MNFKSALEQITNLWDAGHWKLDINVPPLEKYPETTRGLIKRIRKALDHSPQLPEFSIPQNMKNCGVDLQEDPAC